MPAQLPAPSVAALSRYIDRFLFADGWRVTDIRPAGAGVGYEVTLTKEAEPHRGRSVSGTAPSAGEATFIACGSARHLEARDELD